MEVAIEFSPERKEISKALLEAQKKIGPLVKTEINPLYGSRYADLAAVTDAVKGPLNESGIILMQGACVWEKDGRQVLSVETALVHAESGEWVRNVLNLVPVADVIARGRDGEPPITAVTPQTIGKSITYARRYALQAICGIAAEDDDDANGASKPMPQAPRRESEPAPVKEVEGGTEIEGVFSNFRKRTYDDGSVVYFGKLGNWQVWTKDQKVLEGLEKAQGTQITVLGKKSEKKADMFQILQWSPS